MYLTQIITKNNKYCEDFKANDSIINSLEYPGLGMWLEIFMRVALRVGPWFLQDLCHGLTNALHFPLASKNLILRSWTRKGMSERRS